MYQPPWSPMKKNLNQDFVVGVDEGGTRIRAVLARATDGSPLTEGAAGPGNALTVPLPELTDHLATAVAEAVPPELRPRVPRRVRSQGRAGGPRSV
jgi:N-acetylglucosamine kinase-like BadF-type ATPase